MMTAASYDIHLVHQLFVSSEINDSQDAIRTWRVGAVYRMRMSQAQGSVIMSAADDKITGASVISLSYLNGGILQWHLQDKDKYVTTKFRGVSVNVLLESNYIFSLKVVI